VTGWLFHSSSRDKLKDMDQPGFEVDTTTAYLSLMPQLQGMRDPFFKQVIATISITGIALRAVARRRVGHQSYGVAES